MRWGPGSTEYGDPAAVVESPRDPWHAPLSPSAPAARVSPFRRPPPGFSRSCRFLFLAGDPPLCRDPHSSQGDAQCCAPGLSLRPQTDEPDRADDDPTDEHHDQRSCTSITRFPPVESHAHGRRGTPSESSAEQGSTLDVLGARLRCLITHQRRPRWKVGYRQRAHKHSVVRSLSCTLAARVFPLDVLGMNAVFL